MSVLLKKGLLCLNWRMRVYNWARANGINIRVGPFISNLLSPSNISKCGKCQTSWAFVQGHTTKYSSSSGCFPLCEKCWSELTPIERLPYYRDLWDYWKYQEKQYGYVDNVKWESIEKAVLRGR